MHVGGARFEDGLPCWGVVETEHVVKRRIAVQAACKTEWRLVLRNRRKIGRNKQGFKTTLFNDTRKYIIQIFDIKRQKKSKLQKQISEILI